MDESDSSEERDLVPHRHCLLSVEPIRPDVSNWICHRFPMVRSSWSQPARKSDGTIIGIDQNPFDPPRSASINETFTWPGSRFPTNLDSRKPISRGCWSR